jgi:sec-independent protein translocase protein TatA
MFDVGGGELILIILVILLMFGPKRIPELSRQVGKGLRHFRKAQEDLTQQIRDISAEAAEPIQTIQKDMKDLKGQFDSSLSQSTVPRQPKTSDTDSPTPTEDPEENKPEE